MVRIWRSRPPLMATILVVGVALLPGCPGECVGEDCGDAYTASHLTLKRGRRDTVANRGQTALDGVLSIDGTDAQGQDWATRVEPGRVFVGVPDADTVYAIGTDAGGRLEAAGAVLVGEAEGGHFGSALAIASFDGARDLWVGASELQGQGTESGAGAVYRFTGLGEGWTGTGSADQAGLRILAEHALDRLGEGLRSCGDLDGDGNAELLLGAPWDDHSEPLGGRIYLVESAQLGSYQREILAGELPISWGGDSEGAALGRVMRCGDDLDGDGVTELLLGSPTSSAVNRTGAGALYMLDGANLASTRVDLAAEWVLRGSSPETYLGWAIATGDMDGDGHPELVVGAPGADGGAGQVQIMQGSQLVLEDRRPRARVLGVAHDRLGQAVEVGDFNGDGFADLAVGAPRANPSGADNRFDGGAVLLFAGESGLSGWSSSRSTEDADGLISGEQQFLRAGGHLDVGDFDGDGAADLLLLSRVVPP